MKTDDGDCAPASWSPDRACMAGGTPDSPAGWQPEAASVFGPRGRRHGGALRVGQGPRLERAGCAAGGNSV